jgi:hypothetical protein
MITEGILDAFYWVISGLWSVVPEWTWEIPDIAPMMYELSKYDHIAPVSELMLMVGILGALFGVMVAVKAITKVIGWVRGSA